MPFEDTWNVRFTDCDPFGIAHYPKIFEAIHHTSDRFMDEMGYAFWDILEEEEGFALPIVEMNLEFEQPMHAGDVIHITLTPTLGNRSVQFDYEATFEDGSLAFTAFEQRVCAMADGSGSRDIPEGLRAEMEKYTVDAADPED